SVRCILDADAQIIGSVGVLRDLTEQVETQRRLIQREKLASLGEMAAGGAHEHRNPLGGLQMATRLPSSGEHGRGALSPWVGRAVGRGREQNEDRMHSLLEVPRETKLERADYELARILDPGVEGAVGEGRARSVEVGYGRLDREFMAAADGQKLRQVFTNVMK